MWPIVRAVRADRPQQRDHLRSLWVRGPCPRRLADNLEQLIVLQQTPQPLITAALDAGAAHVLHRDFETRSRAVLKTVGAHRYSADPTTEILCVAYAVDDDPVQLWAPGDPIPAEVSEAASNPAWIVVAHNDQFEAANTTSSTPATAGR